MNRLETISQLNLSEYLNEVFGNSTEILSINNLGCGVLGFTYLLDIKIKGKKKRIVLKFANPKGFNQDFPSDRAETLIYANSVYNLLPNHVKSFDIGMINSTGALKKIGEAKDFFILMQYVKGQDYAKDLDRIGKESKLQTLDMERVKLLTEYMARIHKVKFNSPELYTRRIRDLIGRGDCISGIIDSYPKDERTFSFTSEQELEEIEKKCITWRWKIKGKSDRLCQVHGDFHPFNIIWQKPLKFRLLDRSRGEWGEPADDVSALSINYIFWSLMTFNTFKEPFVKLYEYFMKYYLNLSKDNNLLKVIQPFYVFRSLVIANPIFYPNISNENRRKIFDFMGAILETNEFNPTGIASYLEG